MTLLSNYHNGGFEVEIHSDGTKIRTTIDANIAPVLPEQFDLKISQWCDAGCSWCHEQSTPRGKHGDLHATLDLLVNLHPGTEVAIGGGDALSHPDFAWFVRALRARGLVPSVTVNGRHFARSRALLEKLISEGNLFGVGVSYHDSLPSWDYEHMVIHLIAGIHSPCVLDGAQLNYKILLLGYKRFGRGKKHFEIRTEAVQKMIDQWRREIFWVAREHQVSFDNLAIEQLDPVRLFADPTKYHLRHMGQEGQFSMYIDAVKQTFALSSYSSERQSWTDMKSMFAQVRIMGKHAV